MKRIIKMDYSDLTQLWTFCYSMEDTYIKIIAAILDSASHLERLIGTEHSAGGDRRIGRRACSGGKVKLME